ncbi:hypothetical protein HU200_044342 [Digitaria exilis]|uniref:Uncharacterized protein n=1 Tax=Digitaria exilis TaxID=1010633 RepID=A0A835B1W6_9POAL|nr:hypothetical protein HU200_044342 [Digitaria exilis]
MGDLKPRRPTAAEVVGRLKDDGDFDALRRAIVRKVKDNIGIGGPEEALRNKIISEGKTVSGTTRRGIEKLKLKETFQCNLSRYWEQQPKPNLENHNQAKPNGGEPAAARGPAADDDDDDTEVPPGFG